MEQRILGRTDAELSVVGFGGIVVSGVSRRDAGRLVGRAVERGVNYFDVAPAYGNAEERLGPALETYREDVFLACKTGERTAEAAEAELGRSLKRLRTDHLDLYQLHAVASVEDAERILAPGGALEALVSARDRGLVRFIGFSVHSEDAAARLLEAFPFDAMLLPVNLFCWRDGNFGPRACEEGRKRGAGVLAIKALAKRPLRDDETKKWPKCWYVPIDTLPEARTALSFTLSHPVTAAVCPGHAELLWLACDAAETLEETGGGVVAEAEVDGEPIFRS